jgi:hypothetical protein
MSADPGKVEEVVEAFCAKYGARGVNAYYPKTDAQRQMKGYATYANRVESGDQLLTLSVP